MIKFINKTIFKVPLLLIGIFFTSSKISFAQEVESIPQLHKDFQVIVHLVVDDTLRFPKIGDTEIQAVFTTINSYFKPIEANFTVCETRIIENYQFDTISDNSRLEVLERYGVGKRINIFVFSDLVPLDGSAGNADLKGVTNDASGLAGVFIESSSFNSAVVGHEIGHFFGLEHTFSDDNGAELVDGSNCETAGDEVCDTPADPYVVGTDEDDYINDDCVFISGKKDLNGEYYTPLVGNIMSYYNKCSCDQDYTFTNGQYKKMVENYLEDPYRW